MELNRVSILIGKDADYAHKVFEVRKPSTPDSKRKDLRGPLGWVITGTVQSKQTNKQIGVHFISCDKKLHDQVENFRKIEGLGTKSARTSVNYLTNYHRRKDEQSIF